MTREGKGGILVINKELYPLEGNEPVTRLFVVENDPAPIV